MSFADAWQTADAEADSMGVRPQQSESYAAIRIVRSGQRRTQWLEYAYESDIKELITNFNDIYKINSLPDPLTLRFTDYDKSEGCVFVFINICS